jgi:hypothetical protein
VALNDSIQSLSKNKTFFPTIRKIAHFILPKMVNKLVYEGGFDFPAPVEITVKGKPLISENNNNVDDNADSKNSLNPQQYSSQLTSSLPQSSYISLYNYRLRVENMQALISLLLFFTSSTAFCVSTNERFVFHFFFSFHYILLL